MTLVRDILGPRVPAGVVSIRLSLRSFRDGLLELWPDFSVVLRSLPCEEFYIESFIGLWLVLFVRTRSAAVLLEFWLKISKSEGSCLLVPAYSPTNSDTSEATRQIIAVRDRVLTLASLCAAACFLDF